MNVIAAIYTEMIPLIVQVKEWDSDLIKVQEQVKKSCDAKGRRDRERRRGSERASEEGKSACLFACVNDGTVARERGTRVRACEFYCVRACLCAESLRTEVGRDEEKRTEERRDRGGGGTSE